MVILNLFKYAYFKLFIKL